MASTLPQYYSILNVPRSATADEIRAAYKKESLKTHPDRLPGNATAAERRKATERFQTVADAYYVLSDPTRRAEYDSLFSHSQSQSRSGRPFTSTSSSSSGTASGGGGVPGGWTFTDDNASEYEQERASSSFFENFAQFFPSAAGAAGAASGAFGSGSGSGSGSGPRPSEKANAASGGGGFFGFGGGKNKNQEDEGEAEGTRRPDAHGVFGDVFEEMLAPEVAHVRPWYSWVGGASGAALGYIVANVPGAVAGGFAGNRLGAIRDAKGKSVAQVFAGLGASQKAEILRALAFKVLGSMAA